MNDALFNTGGAIDRKIGMFVCNSLFTTVTNTNFDPDRLHGYIARALAIKREIRARHADILKRHGDPSSTKGKSLPEEECVVWDSTDQAEIVRKAYQVGVLSTTNEDIRSLREMTTYALKGMAAYTYHANILGYFDDAIVAFIYGPIIVTSNCITPVQPPYAGRIFTTGPAAYPGVRQILRDEKERIDFGDVIALAKRLPPPTQIDDQIFTGGFGWRQLAEASPKIIGLVRSGKIKRFIVIAGCDGRDRSRIYYREVAERLPVDSIILTAGCAKYRFMKLNLGDIDGIPRIIDAGQCNDCYSLVRIAMLLMEGFAVKSINDLPISFDIAWYDQKAVAVLLSLLQLGVAGLRLGPTLPGFLSPRVRTMLVEKFALRPIGTSEADARAMMAGS